ncbi:hypothetical protein ABEB36_001863 [Hypothenemus hampei]|uniref:Uncharacterized protein n=1 Tax=Hypothenemus hampei TaxID=57062 RepID=A0ABD1FG31_HYPHA
MVAGCKKLWIALQLLWGTLYVVCGSFQLMGVIFCLVVIRELSLYSVLVAGSWNIVMGIAGITWSCIGPRARKKQEILLYLAFSVLSVNTVTAVLTEWDLYFFDMSKLSSAYSNHALINCAIFVIRIAVATVIVVAFLDCQFAFCSIQTFSECDKTNEARTTHEQVSDIEYIIPRHDSVKVAGGKLPQRYETYGQSWVFDTTEAGTSNGMTPSSGKAHMQNGLAKNPLGRPKVPMKNVTQILENPVVHVDEVSDDSTSHSDRKIVHMKSFSRSTSPVILSNTSSQISLNQATPPISEYLEKLTEPQIYRSRLNTVVSRKSQEEEAAAAEEEEKEGHYQSPQTLIKPVATSQEPVHYSSSLMKELQKAISNKNKVPSNGSSSQSESQSPSRSSDVEFSKELEAALQLIQDLESPNTPGATSQKTKSMRSEKTLSPDGSLTEISSPTDDSVIMRKEPSLSPELKSGKQGVPATARTFFYYHPDSQSTSGYSSPSHVPTPINWSTTSSLNGSQRDIIILSPPKPTISYHIHQNNQSKSAATVISLFTTTTPQSSAPVSLERASGKGEKVKSVSLVEIAGDHLATTVRLNNSSNCGLKRKSSSISAKGWSVMSSLLRRRRSPAIVGSTDMPKLCAELEDAIIKSESLAYLTEEELIARARRNDEMLRVRNHKTNHNTLVLEMVVGGTFSLRDIFSIGRQSVEFISRISFSFGFTEN